VTIVPVGGLDKVATFVALLGANELELAVLHDHAGKPDAHLESVIREKLVREKQVLNYGVFRDGKKPSGKAGGAMPLPATDVEDLITPDLYLKLFNGAFNVQLAGEVITESDLPEGDRIVERINRYLASNKITVRPSGGFNHYAVANYLVANPPRRIDPATLGRFEALFNKVNALFGA
jgi:hypothetical protein